MMIYVTPVNLTHGTVRRGRFQRARLAIHVIDDDDDGDVYLHVPAVVSTMCHEHSTGYSSRELLGQASLF